MDRLLTLQQVEGLVGLKRSTIYEAIRRDGFPAPVKITDRASRWRESELQEYIDGRPRDVGDLSRPT